MVKLSISQSTVESFAANSTQKAMMIHRRLTQKKNGVIESVPLLKKTKEKITEFDQKMTERFGKNYTKIRNIAVGVGKFYLAGQLGAPGLIALGTINTVKAIKPMIKAAKEQREAGQVSGILDFIKKNPKNCAKTMLSASLGAAVIGCGLAHATGAKLCSRAGVAALVIIPEVKSLKETTKQWIKGEAPFKNIINDIATVGLSAGAFVAGSDWDYEHADLGGTASADVAVPVAKADRCPPSPCIAAPKHIPAKSLQHVILDKASLDKAAAQKAQKNKITLAVLKKNEATQ